MAVQEHGRADPEGAAFVGGGCGNSKMEKRPSGLA